MSPALTDKHFYGGVYDGHGNPHGAKQAELAAVNVPTVLNRVISEDGSAANVAEAMRSACTEHQDACVAYYNEHILAPVVELKAKIEAEQGVDIGPITYPHEGGTTATIVVLSGHTLWCGWVGDSRAVIAAKGESGLAVSFETADHSVDNAAEVERVAAAGGTTFGRYFAVNGCEGMLQLSRSLGDVGFHRDNVVTSQPEVATRTITAQDMFLLAASDGVWSVFSSVEAIEFVYRELCRRGYPAPAAADGDVHKELLAVAQQLEKEAHRRVGTKSVKADDIGVMIITFETFWATHRTSVSGGEAHAEPAVSDSDTTRMLPSTVPGESKTESA